MTPNDITFSLFEELFPYASDRNREKYYDALITAMVEFRINNLKRIAAFLAQITHESGSLKYDEEIASGLAYNQRADLGNTEPRALELAKIFHGVPVGIFYKGRSLIQLTGYYNYVAAGKALGLELAEKPFIAKIPEISARIAAWFWETHECNELADADKFKKITKKINGGYNGYEDRLNHWKRITKTLTDYKEKFV